ncbi:MAG: serine/threonine protein kinase [Deltaproteobacteria bacterium]|nr:serine/threonine protein kinase [Deltaproteobacteria bacterium]
MSRALGRYELLRPLARGGMAEVYLARRRAAGVEKWLVVKRIRAAFANDVRFLDLFVREARLSMSLAHQNIVPVFDFGRIDDQVFLAMERIEGKDLGASLERAAAALPPLLAAFIASECCQALDYAHHRKSPDGTALGIVHRDVTPRNVLLSWSGEVKLTDFGIAALAGDATTKLVGTPAYMAPEQARGEPIDARSDVYAVGLVLREMLTAQRARPQTERGPMIEAAMTGALVAWRAGVPPAIVAIVDRATAISPADRFPDARSMLAELDDFMLAERAAHKSEAPARALAAWLADLWVGERDDRGIDGEVAGDHLVSFLDDGPLDVVGTGTQRSLLATAGDDESPAPPRKKPVTEEALAATQVAGQASTDAAATTAPMGRRTTRWLAPMLLVVSALGVVAVIKLGGGDRTVEKPPVVVAHAPAIDAARPDAASDASLLIDAPIDAAIDAAVAVAPRDAAATKLNTAPPKLPDKPVVALRKVTINATPWAYFTVDNDPTQHETMKTLQLAPGKHRIQFSNPVLKVERTVTIEVPEDRDLAHVERLGN